MTPNPARAARSVVARNRESVIATKEAKAMSRTTYYPASLNFRVSQPVAEAVAREAARTHANEAEICRRMLLAGLQAHGVQVPAPAEAGG